jgi:hypothetical protein
MDEINRYLKQNRRSEGLCDHIECNDGFTISVQASQYHYCKPRRDNAYPYTHFELGYPYDSDDLILEYAEDKDFPTLTVYGNVPLEIVKALIDKHGGIKGE